MDADKSKIYSSRMTDSRVVSQRTGGLVMQKGTSLVSELWICKEARYLSKNAETFLNDLKVVLFRIYHLSG